jgi:hypothetical protein
MIEWMSDVSSPQTKAPEPSRTSTSKEKPRPRMSSPMSPYSRAWSSATRMRLIASGYSVRT